MLYLEFAGTAAAAEPTPRRLCRWFCERLLTLPDNDSPPEHPAEQAELELKAPTLKEPPHDLAGLDAETLATPAGLDAPHLEDELRLRSRAEAEGAHQEGTREPQQLGRAEDGPTSLEI